jgi:hypothetical protein
MFSNPNIPRFGPSDGYVPTPTNAALVRVINWWKYGYIGHYYRTPDGQMSIVYTLPDKFTWTDDQLIIEKPRDI